MSAITSLNSVYRGGNVPKPVRGYITPMDADGTLVKDLLRSFQYFPETIQDTKANNWQAKEIPGLSHPLYQWTAGGAREVSFTAVFTRDRANTSAEKANIAKHQINTNDDQRNVDIPSAISWLRSFKYPNYGYTDAAATRRVRPQPPQKLVLTLPGVRLNNGTHQLCPSEMFAIMQTCDVSYEGFFSDGTPRLVRVQLVFAEIIQIGRGVYPHSAHQLRFAARTGYKDPNPRK